MKRREFLDCIAKGIVISGAPMAAVEASTAASGSTLQLPSLNWQPRSDWISVESTGAVGDGKADDTSAIQKAFDLIKRGITIYFPVGIYRVTRTLVINSPDKLALYGVLIVGHGRATRLVWDGVYAEAMIREEGMGYARWTGFDLDGSDRATIGQHHFSKSTFETVHRKQHMSFRGFTKAAVYADPQDAFAMAETSFENCLFERCRTGVSFTQFNDYNISFDGCEFRKCHVGIECIHGNFYVRNSHFEASADADIVSAPEHGSSARRCTSNGSMMFIRHANPVAVITIEGCAIGAWRNPAGAISISGAPALVFDCAFTDPPSAGSCAIRTNSSVQRLITSQNTVPPGFSLLNGETKSFPDFHRYEIPSGQRAGMPLRPTQQFLRSTVAVPGRVFDAKRDFGAAGDAKGDDTVAIQRTIDAARDYGRGSMAYLPSGRYVVRETLHLSGSNYHFGGAGMLSTMLHWAGESDGTTIAVADPDHITVQHLDLQKNSGIDILQTSTGRPSFVTYDGVFVSRFNEPPFSGGLCFRGLNSGCTVLIPCMAGTLHAIDCAMATIIVALSYYGAVIAEGRATQRNGLLGILSRFSGGKYNVVMRDSQSLVMSDFYSESSGNIFLLEGQADDAPGRVTVQAAKLHLLEKTAADVINVRNYAGQVFLGPGQFNGPLARNVSLRSEQPLELFLVGNCFYHPALNVKTLGGANFTLLGNIPVATKDVPSDRIAAMFADTLPSTRLGAVAAGLDDLRRLGADHLRLSYL